MSAAETTFRAPRHEVVCAAMCPVWCRDGPSRYRVTARSVSGPTGKSMGSERYSAPGGMNHRRIPGKPERLIGGSVDPAVGHRAWLGQVHHLDLQRRGAKRIRKMHPNARAARRDMDYLPQCGVFEVVGAEIRSIHLHLSRCPCANPTRSLSHHLPACHAQQKNGKLPPASPYVHESPSWNRQHSLPCKSKIRHSQTAAAGVSSRSRILLRRGPENHAYRTPDGGI